MTGKAILASITILISMLLLDNAQVSLGSITCILLLLAVFVRLPITFIILYCALSWSIFYKHTVINEANKAFSVSLKQTSWSVSKNAFDNIITAEIITIVNRNNSLSFHVNVLSVNGILLDFPRPNLALRWPYYTNAYPGVPQLGQQWRFLIRLQPVAGKKPSSGYTLSAYQSGLLSRHIVYQGTVKRGEMVRASDNIRNKLFQRFMGLLPPEASPLLPALSFADRSLITAKQWQLFQHLGISHLMAISGLHIGLIFGASWLLLTQFGRLINRQINLLLGLGISLLAAIAYAWLAGFSLPAMRAVVLLTLTCLYRLSYLRVTLLQLFVFMLIITLLLDPLSVYSNSFWLSFSAMAAVFVLLWCGYTNQTTAKRWWQTGYYLVVGQLMLNLLLLPVQGLLFSGFSWLAPLVNLLMVPLFSVIILPLLLLGVLVMPVLPWLSAYLFVIVNSLLTQLILFWDWLGAGGSSWVDFSHMRATSSYLLLLLCYALTLCGLVFLPVRRISWSLLVTLLPLYYYFR